ncbi:MAG: HNH endonuclease signature motif containing protein [Arcobacter sp.]|uniref:HNH endonuclease signature motif containing protein n=1 Tax=Arcobacter sp. TaxID=1872629 RepID=UPI00258C72F8|nr:HNH endonuclease signature motif containing protein [Arcobacter sp.]MDD3009645.1 HNH endonuclease signature motif containing protein [Arcobacter sp.]
MNILEKKLEEQLKLLKNSAELFDKGKTEEALNIAIRLRVLFYRDESLLEQLGQKKTINMLSTFEDYSKDPMLKNIKIQFSVPFLTSNGQRAFLDKTGRSELIPLNEWLTETITTLENKAYSRIDIIKITAHKDGAAHIEIDHKSLKPFITPFAITKEELEIGNMECHHIQPRSQGGLDNYNNLVLITKEVHKLIHSTQMLSYYLQTSYLKLKLLKQV